MQSAGCLSSFQARFVLVERIGQHLFRGETTDDGCAVAIKVSEQVATQEEAFLMNAVKHPHLSSVVDAWLSPWHPTSK